MCLLVCSFVCLWVCVHLLCLCSTLSGTTTVPASSAARTSPAFVFGAQAPQECSFTFQLSVKMAGVDTPCFQPIGIIPDLDRLKIGVSEEDSELVLFHEMAHLFAFTGGQWKSRGQGNLELVQKKRTGKVHLRMPSHDQPFTVLANHTLVKGMTVKRMVSSDRGFIWFASSDNLAAHFKSREIAEKFEKVFMTNVPKT